MSLHLPVSILAALSLTSGDRVVGPYDGPLMGINHASSAHSSLDEARSLIQLDLCEVIAKETVTQFQKLNANIADDLGIVRERVVNEDVTVALEHAECRVPDFVLALNPPDHGLMMLPRSFSVEESSRIAAAALDDLVEVVPTHGFGYRMEAEDSVAAARAKMFGLAICAALVALILAFFLDIL
jgi:methyl-accepting chemotaxis protein